MTARYKRVPQNEDSDGEEIKKRRADRIDRITAKIHAIFWVLAAGGTLLYTNFFHIGLTDSRVNRYFFSFSCIYIL